MNKNLETDFLLSAYASGYFPMPEPHTEEINGTFLNRELFCRWKVFIALEHFPELYEEANIKCHTIKTLLE